MNQSPARSVLIFGAGPAGLMAGERLSAAGVRVEIREKMASPARKFLLAGRGGLNLTHSEPLDRFLERYTGSAAGLVKQAVRDFPPAELVSWCEGLGLACFTGSSGRIFPKSFKASPLARAWLRRLSDRGVTILPGQVFDGFAGLEAYDAVLLALGGASWPRLGADGNWRPVLVAAGVPVSELRPSNCGVTVGWTAYMARHQGAPLKRIAVRAGAQSVRGEAIITAGGLEGGAIYALSQAIRTDLDVNGKAQLIIDLRPDLSQAELTARLAAGRKGQSVANLLRKSAGLAPAAAALLREAPLPATAAGLAEAIKSVRVTVTGLAGLARAISTAGGVTGEAVDSNFMLKARAGIFVAGEMLDVDAPTGGYLLQAAFASGVAAARGMLAWMESDHPAKGEKL